MIPQINNSGLLKIKLIFILGLIFNWHLTCFPISRIGNGGIINEKLGYTITPPKFLSNTEIINDETIRFRGGFTFNSFAMSYVEVYPLYKDFPELLGTDLKEFNEQMETWNYTKIEVSSNPCLQFWIRESKTAYTAIVKWGRYNGYTIVGPNLKSVNIAISEIVESTVLTNGICLWEK